VGSIQVNHLQWRRPGGAVLLDDVTFHVGDGEHVALVGANGVGKSTLLGLIAAAAGRPGVGIAAPPAAGTIAVDGRVGVLRQLMSRAGEPTSVRDLLVSLATARVSAAGKALLDTEAAVSADPGDERVAIAYAQAVADWGEAGGYDTEVEWDACTSRVLGLPYDSVADRPLHTLSGGEQKHLALDALLTGEHDVLLLDEPDNFLDVTGKRWLEDQLQASPKTVLYVSHDRELLAATATKVVTVEARGAWTHGGAFDRYHEARTARIERIERDVGLHDRERERLEALIVEMRRRAQMSDKFSSRLKAAENRLKHFDATRVPPERVVEQRIDVRLGGRRTGKKVLTFDSLELDDLTYPFDGEIWFGERVAVIGPNGAGKSHFLRLLAGEPVAHAGTFTLGAGVAPGYFRQSHDHPELTGRTLLAILESRDIIRGPAMSRLRRYELQGCAEQTFETLSGGQQARFMILLLEVAGCTLLLLDEPTDNLDLVSAEALEAGLEQFEGTVVAVTHDRWFLRGFDRFLVFEGDGEVRDALDPPPVYASSRAGRSTASVH
jgi:ATPase subunit of ABC transporter with duplicated ATPase domains